MGLATCRSKAAIGYADEESLAKREVLMVVEADAVVQSETTWSASGHSPTRQGSPAESVARSMDFSPGSALKRAKFEPYNCLCYWSLLVAYDESEFALIAVMGECLSRYFGQSLYSFICSGLRIGKFAPLVVFSNVSIFSKIKKEACHVRVSVRGLSVRTLAISEGSKLDFVVRQDFFIAYDRNRVSGPNRALA